MSKHVRACVCSGSSVGGGRDGSAGVWSGELSRNAASFGYSEKHVTISLESGASQGGSDTARPVKEVPLWIAQSTVDGADQQPTDRHAMQVCTILSWRVATQLIVAKQLCYFIFWFI